MSIHGVFGHAMTKAERMYLHHVSGCQLQQNKRVISVDTLCVSITAVLTGHGATIRIAEELGCRTHEHVVVKKGEWAEPAPSDQHILLVQRFLWDLQFPCTWEATCNLLMMYWLQGCLGCQLSQYSHTKLTWRPMMNTNVTPLSEINVVEHTSFGHIQVA